MQRAERERQLARLAARRVDVELAHQERLERRLQRIDDVLDRLEKLPLVDKYTAKGKTKGLNLMGYAKLLVEFRATALDAVLGVRPIATEATSGANVEALLARLLDGRKRAEA